MTDQTNEQMDGYVTSTMNQSLDRAKSLQKWIADHKDQLRHDLRTGNPLAWDFCTVAQEALTLISGSTLNRAESYQKKLADLWENKKTI